MIEVHTFDISHKITEWEAKNLKQKYQIQNKQETITKTGIKGINQIQIKEHYIPKGKIQVAKTLYHLCIQVNLGKLLGSNSIRMIAIDKQSRKKMETALHKIMVKNLQLNPKNCDVQDWTLNRLDYGKDINFQGNDPNTMVCIYIRLLNHALNLNNNRNCNLISYQGSHNANTVYESVYFGNKSYTYNIYNKLNQLNKEYSQLTPQQQIEAQGLLRIEKQVYGKGLTTLGTSKKLALLFDDVVIQKLFSTMKKELQLFFGTNNFTSRPLTVNAIIQSNYPPDYKKQLVQMIADISNYGFCHFVKEEIKKGTNINNILQYRNDVEKLGTSVSYILDEEVEKIKITALPALSKLFDNNPTQKSKKCKKESFGKIYKDKKNCRYRCNFTIHEANGKSKRISMADKNSDELERKIFCKLVQVHKDNLQQMQGNQTETLSIIKQTIVDIEKFRTIIKTPTTIQIIDLILNNLYKNQETINQEI